MGVGSSSSWSPPLPNATVISVVYLLIVFPFFLHETCMLVLSDVIYRLQLRQNRIYNFLNKWPTIINESVWATYLAFTIAIFFLMLITILNYKILSYVAKTNCIRQSIFFTLFVSLVILFNLL